MILLIASAIFSGTETAFTSINEIRLMNEKETSGVRLLKEMLKKKTSVIGAILVGNNIVNTVLAVYAGAFFDDVLVGTGVLTEKTGPLVASGVTITFLLVFGEVIPKHFAVTFSRLWMKIFSLPLWLVVFVLKPVTRAMDFFSRLMISFLPVKKEDGNSPTIQELLIMARFSASAGHIDEIERKLVVRATRFNDLEARDVMVPRTKVVAVPESIGYSELLKDFQGHLYSRIPVYKDSVDNIIGVFYAKEMLLLNDEQRRNFSITRHCRDPFFAPEGARIGALLDQMKTLKKHMCVVVDEFGATAGILTLEDVIERIFGLIHDEYDEESSQIIKKIDENEFLVNGSASLEEVEQSLEISFSAEIKQQVNTISGLAVLLKDDFPKERDEFRHEDLLIKVKEAKGMRATRLILQKLKK